MTNQIEAVKKYYAATLIDYRFLWTGTRDLAMHMGYWADGITSHTESLLKMNAVLAGLAKINKDDRVLDAGCGFGGSAMWLASNIGCQVTGITVVAQQLERARRQAVRFNLSDKTTFSLQDYARTSFPNQSFTVVWGLESIVHAESKPAVMNEAFRLLKPGGRVIISEYLLRDNPPLTDSEHTFIAPWLKGWAMPSLMTSSQYRKILTAAGFKNVTTHDLTERVRRSLNKIGWLGYLGTPLVWLLWKLHIVSEQHYGNAVAASRQHTALQRGFWRYVVVTAEK
jgi:tocopherol O-methyltransferase